MMMMNTKTILLLALTALFACSSSSAFVSPSTSTSSSRNTAVVSRSSPFSVPPQPTATATSATTSTTALAGRRWNFNEGQAPWGLKKNAEIWNGRVSQELVQGKGVVVGLQEGDPVNQAVLGGFVVTTLGLTAWLAIKGKDDYTKEEM